MILERILQALVFAVLLAVGALAVMYLPWFLWIPAVFFLFCIAAWTEDAVDQTRSNLREERRWREGRHW